MFYEYVLVFVCITVLILLGIYIAKIKPNNKKNIKDLYSEGLDMMINGQQRSAYNNFKKIVEIDSENIKAYLRLGQVLRESGNPLKALKIHKGLIIRQNLTSYELLDLHKNIALDYFELKKIGSAIDEVLKILKIDKNNEWALSKLIKFYSYIGKWTESTKFLSKLHKVTKKPDDHKMALFIIQEGRALQVEGNFSLAREKFEKSLEVYPSLSASYFFIAETYAQESEKYFQKAEKISNSSSDLNKEQLDKALNFLSKAVPMWIKYSKTNPNQSWMVIHLLKDALFALNRYDELEHILKEIIDKDNKNSEVIASLADMFAHKGDLKNALDIIDSNINKNSKSLIIKLIRLKLLALDDSQNISKELDKLINFFVTDEGYHLYNDTKPDEDIVWINNNSNDVKK
jgi:lipopolysaccharide biosynthesis regulator YciM|tara:strand:- start:1770 stop:2975 length:1206 start_codon:yes stop_codon:yes gene_type:complete